MYIAVAKPHSSCDGDVHSDALPASTFARVTRVLANPTVLLVLVRLLRAASRRFDLLQPGKTPGEGARRSACTRHGSG